MSDRLSALLQRFDLHARVFHSGALCGRADFDGGAGVGHLHLVRRGPLGVIDTLGRHCVIHEPSVLFFPRAGVHRLDGGEGEGADVVCASIDFGAGDENPLLRGLPALLNVPLARLPGLDLAQQLLFNEAQASRCGHGAVVDRLNAETAKALADPVVRDRLLALGLEPRTATPEQLGQIVASGHARVAAIVKK